MFSSHLTSVTFLADPSAGGGLPRGTFIYATSPIPVQVAILVACTDKLTTHHYSYSIVFIKLWYYKANHIFCVSFFFLLLLFCLFFRLHHFTGNWRLCLMEILRMTVAPLCLLALPQKQKRETVHGLILLAHVSSTSTLFFCLFNLIFFFFIFFF